MICDRALLGAFTQEDHRAGAALVRQAASEVYGRPVPAPWLKWTTAAAVAAARRRSSRVGVWTLPRRSARTTPSTPTRRARQRPAAATAAPRPVRRRRRSIATAGGRSRRAGRSPVAHAVPLDELLVRHGNDTTTEAALGKLFALWGALYEPARGRGCDQAATAGPRVPVPEGLVGAAARAEPPGRSSRSPTTWAAPTRWCSPGSATRTPRSTSAASRARSRSPRCRATGSATSCCCGGRRSRWSRRSPPACAARTCAGCATACAPRRACRPRRAGSDVYDDELTRLVQDFQRQHRLAVDGVAGVQTQIALDTALNATGSPTIVAPGRGRLSGMSFILDALRKSEHERQRQTGPALVEVAGRRAEAEVEPLGHGRDRAAGREPRRHRRAAARTSRATSPRLPRPPAQRHRPPAPSCGTRCPAPATAPAAQATVTQTAAPSRPSRRRRCCGPAERARRRRAPAIRSSGEISSGAPPMDYEAAARAAEPPPGPPAVVADAARLGGLRVVARAPDPPRRYAHRPQPAHVEPAHRGRVRGPRRPAGDAARAARLLDRTRRNASCSSTAASTARATRPQEGATVDEITPDGVIMNARGNRFLLPRD